MVRMVGAPGETRQFAFLSIATMEAPGSLRTGNTPVVHGVQKHEK